VSGHAERAAAAAAALLDAAAAAQWRGPDPYDGLWWPAPAPLRAGRRRRQAIVQLHARLPVDLRGAYRRPAPLIPKTLGLFARTALDLHARTGDERYVALCATALDRTPALVSPGGATWWGYPFDVQTRWSFYPAGAPNVVVTSFVGMALLEAGERLGREDYAARARDAAGAVLDRLFSPERGHFVYHGHSDTLIHNANLLAARLVWRALGDDAAAADAVRRALEPTLAAQRADGAWGYGEGPGLGYVDGLHTGYILECLAEMDGASPAVAGAIARGARYYVDGCFRPDGAAKLRPERDHPEDGHSAGTGLSALTAVAPWLADAPAAADRVAARALDAMIAGGRGVFRRYAWGASRVRYLRWVDAHLAAGLARHAAARVPAAA
jgi:hypothetical protein